MLTRREELNGNDGEIPLGPCPADQFSGRYYERSKLMQVISAAKDRGQVFMVSGRRGSGKSSFLNWAENEIQLKANENGCPAIKSEFFETPGMIFTIYKRLLTELKAHEKFGWFKNLIDDSNVRKSIDVALEVISGLSSLTGPYAPVLNTGTAAAKKLLPGEIVDHAQLLASFLAIFRGLGCEMVKKNKSLTILLDDVQWSSGPDFQLMKDLMRNLPAGFALIIAFRVESDSEKKYIDLQNEIYRYGYEEIKLGKMQKEEIKEFADQRYKISIDDQVAEFLSNNVGDPLCLMGCFNLLKKTKRMPDLKSFQQILPKALDSARCIYTGLDACWQNRINSLCILRPPMYLTVISCMLKEHDTARLKDELDHSLVFMSLDIDKESYDFAHPSLREYRRKELPKGKVIELNSIAAKCLEKLEAGL